LVADHFYMIRATIRGFARNGWPVDDEAESACQAALVRAAQKYRPEDGVKFSTQAWPWLHGAVKRSISKGAKHRGESATLETIPDRDHDEPDESTTEARDMARLVVETAINQLAPHNRPIARLIVQGRGYKRIGRMLDMTEWDARQTTDRIRDYLARLIQCQPLSDTPTLFDDI
jgi:RNA polymerase sigma factor (sigma-70 family)